MKRDKFGRNRILTTEEYIAKCRSVHGDRYDYSKVNYIGVKEDVVIICKIHGDFKKDAGRHSGGVDCPECSEIEKNINRAKREAVKFIEKSKKVHGDKYNYDKVIYVKSNQNVIITCPIHGDFEQTPANHKRGAGCYDCGLEKLRQHFKLSQEEVRKRSFDKFGIDFKIDLTNYKNINSIVVFYCPIHGMFEDKISNHLASEDGCPTCFEDKDRPSWNRLSVEENMKVLKELYGDSYHFFSEDIDISANKVRFWCYRHKRFHSTKLGHLRYGYACPECGNETKVGFYTKCLMEREKEYYSQDQNNIYIFKLENGLHKIGIAKMPNARNSQVKNQSGYEQSEVIYTKSGSTYNCFYLEQELHEVLKVSRKVFDYKWAGYTEVFCIDEGVVQDVIHKIEDRL